jgi:hypothetical protein
MRATGGGPDRAPVLAAAVVDVPRAGRLVAPGRFAAPAFEYYFLCHGIEPNAAVGPVLGVAPAQPGRPTYLTLLEARPPTLEEAIASYPALRGSRLVERVPGGAVYRSPPA